MSKLSSTNNPNASGRWLQYTISLNKTKSKTMCLLKSATILKILPTLLPILSTILNSYDQLDLAEDLKVTMAVGITSSHSEQSS